MLREPEDALRDLRRCRYPRPVIRRSQLHGHYCQRDDYNAVSAQRFFSSRHESHLRKTITIIGRRAILTGEAMREGPSVRPPNCPVQRLPADPRERLPAHVWKS